MISFSTVRPVIFLVVLHLAVGQRVAPGVPPNQYQPPPQYQQQQQVPNPQYQQQHQPPPPQHQQQFQQPPPQQQHHQQQPPPQQQHHQPPPQHQQAHHGHHGGQPQVLNPGNIQEERDHIKEHLEVPMDTSKMTEQELQFHYFKMHDSDNNNKLDGCELIKSLIHWHEQGSKEQPHGDGQPHVEEKLFSDEELVALIDPILQMDDLSRDGYIDYPEFIKAQQKAAKHQKP
ncbi:nuclear transcription factor Y subunit beta isoform X1 [Sergentomyia squamirostris]